VAVARGVDADAEAGGRGAGVGRCGRRGCGHKASEKGGWDRGRSRGGPPRSRTPRKLVMRGQGLKT
jgi:hypothetical protein